jgi:hypothetical protein
LRLSSPPLGLPNQWALPIIKYKEDIIMNLRERERERERERGYVYSFKIGRYCRRYINRYIFFHPTLKE